MALLPKFGAAFFLVAAMISHAIERAKLRRPYCSRPPPRNRRAVQGAARFPIEFSATLLRAFARFRSVYAARRDINWSAFSADLIRTTGNRFKVLAGARGKFGSGMYRELTGLS